MAIATATALTAASLAISAGTTGMSFAQAGKQRKSMRQAERDAAEAMQAARKKLQINVYDELGIQKEPYELEREALLSQGAQAIQAGVESERGAAATAGRIQMAQQEGQAGVRSAFGQELSAIEKMSAAEESRLRDIGVQLDLEETAGAQLAAANAAELGAQATQQGMQGITNTAQQAVSAIPLFEKSASAKQFSQLQSEYGKAAKSGNLASQFMKNGAPMNFQEAIKTIGATTPPSAYGFDISGIGAMEPTDFQLYMTQQPSQKLKMLKEFDFYKAK